RHRLRHPTHWVSELIIDSSGFLGYIHSRRGSFRFSIVRDTFLLDSIPARAGGDLAPAFPFFFRGLDHQTADVISSSREFRFMPSPRVGWNSLAVSTGALDPIH